MMAWILLILSALTFAKAPTRWNATTEIVEKHEFYQNNEVISKPKNSWEIIFAFIYPDTSLNLHKDCVYYKVPGDGAGILKVKISKPEIPCEKFRYDPGDIEVRDLKSFQFTISKTSVYFHLTYTNFKSDRWDMFLMNNFTAPEIQYSLSSAKLQSPEIIMVASGGEKNEAKENLKGICHDIAEDCSEKLPSVCHKCSEGWFEIPNGCAIGPKFCGVQECGGKNRPACRRGMKYQRNKKTKFVCSEDSSFAYCSKGFSVECEGALAYCR